MAGSLLLAIDVGNTNTVFALYRERAPLGQWRMSTVRERTADEYAAALTQLMALKGFAHGSRRGGDLLGRAAGADPAQAHVPRSSAARHGGRREPRRQIAVADRQPAEVGADRLVNAVGAHSRYGGPLIVVDFGTATTFDVVDGDGGYRGGAIAPGINLSLEALHHAAAKLPRIAIEPPAAVIGSAR